MDIELHKLAKTTPVAWAYIQHPSQSGPALGHELGISLRTVYKRNAFIHRFVCGELQSNSAKMLGLSGSDIGFK